MGVTACQQQKVVTEVVPDAIRISETERHRRIALDFRKDKESVVAYLQNYYPLVTDSMLDAYIELKMGEVTRYRQSVHPVEYDMYFSL